MTTQELTKEVMKQGEEIAQTAESCKSAHKRLDSVEKEQKEQSRLLVVVERLANGIEHVNEKVDSLGEKVDGLGNRITTIEQEPAGKWKQLSWVVLVAVVCAVVGYVLGQIGLKP